MADIPDYFYDDARLANPVKGKKDPDRPQGQGAPHFDHFRDALDDALRQAASWPQDHVHSTQVQLSVVINPGQILRYEVSLNPGS